MLRRSARNRRLGLALTEQGVHISVAEKRASEWQWTKQHFIDAADWPQHLRPWIEREGLNFCPCNLVLPANKYQIVQVDRPAVDEEEIHSALQWAMKDILSANEDLQLDYFDLPAQAAGANKVSVVVANKKEITKLANILQTAELEPLTITIEEFVLLDNFGHRPDAVATLFQHAGQEVSLNIFKQGQLYFTRRLKGYELLSSLSIDELNNGMLEALATEIQRSMDYFDSQLHQAALRKIELVLDSDFPEEIAEGLKNLLFIDVENVKPQVPKSEQMVMLHAYSMSAAATQLNTDKSAREHAA